MIILCDACSNCGTTDFYSFIISVLAILVTILIGWQIYQAIGFESKMKKVDDALFIVHNDSLALSSYNMAIIFERIGEISNSIKSIELAIDCYKKTNNTEMVKRCELMLENLKKQN